MDPDAALDELLGLVDLIAGEADADIGQRINRHEILRMTELVEALDSSNRPAITGCSASSSTSIVADRLCGSIPITTLPISTLPRLSSGLRSTEEGSAISSWSDPSGATPRHGARRGACHVRATPTHRGQPM